jgi:TetR/AcrR family transcriptional regulator
MESQMAKAERQAREKERRRNLILKSALLSFAKYGYHKCSMDLIAEEAELGKSTIYYYFKNKDELLLEVLKAGLESFFEKLTDKWAELQNPKEKIESVSFAAAEFFAENPDYFKLYLYLSLHPKIKGVTTKSIRPIIENKNKIFIKLFKDAQKAGIIKPMSPQNLVQIFGTLIMGVGIFGHYKRKADIRKRMTLINEIFFEGVTLKKED